MTSQHNQLELPGSHPHSNGLSHREPTLSERVRGAFPPTLVALYDSNQGLALIALAQLFFACMSLSVKFLIQSEYWCLGLSACVSPFGGHQRA
jgi:hypothetical protein